MDLWQALESIGTVAAAGVAAYAALQARSSARESNAAATKLTTIEAQRRHNELCPRLRVACEPLNVGSENPLRLRIMLVGPPGLDRIDGLRVVIRNDQLHRGEGSRPVMGGPTPEQVEEHIWGPYRFLSAPHGAKPDDNRRVVDYNGVVPLGEELPFQLEPTMPGWWMTGTSQPDWERRVGKVLRLAITAEHKEYGTWYLPCEVDTASMPATVYAPQQAEASRQP